MERRGRLSPVWVFVLTKAAPGLPAIAGGLLVVAAATRRGVAGRNAA